MDLIIILAVIIVLLLAVLIVFNQMNKKKREMMELTKKKQREAVLDHALRNPAAEESQKKNGVASMPYAVDYSKGRAEGGGADEGQSQVMVQVTEINELSERKYMLDPRAPITIGRQTGVNRIVASADTGIGERQCEIFLHRRGIFVRNINPDIPMVVLRKKQSAYVNETGIRLESNDRIQIAKIEFVIVLIDANGEIIY